MGAENLMEMPSMTNNAIGYSQNTWANPFVDDFMKRTDLLATFDNKIQKLKETDNKDKNMTYRIVNIYLVDANSDIDNDKAILYSREGIFTDLQDSDLFFEIENIKELLKAHNDYRAQVLDKTATREVGRDIFLEKIRISDLVFNVVTIAKF